MYEITVKLADIPILIRTNESRFRAFFANYATAAEPEFSVCASREDIEEARILCRGTKRGEFGIESVALSLKIETELAGRGVLRLHASAIAVDGEAYLFAAPSGTGKSTHTRLWREYFGDRAVMINDDKPYVRIENGKATAYGSPWSGKERLNTNTSAAVKGVAILHRDTYNHIERAEFSSVLSAVYFQSTPARDPATAGNVLELLDRLGGAVPFYSLGCTISREAVELAYKTMKEGKTE